jgi:DNA uptake protein ComE-like DNA-binding protein
VLLLTTWAVAALTVLVISQATRVSLELKWANRLRESRQAWHVAWAGLRAAANELAIDPDPAWDAPKEAWGKSPEEPVRFASGQFSYRVQDEQARISLSSAPLDLLLLLPGFTPQAAQELIARRQQGKRIGHLAELRFLPGFQEESLQELIPLVTVVADGPVNLNTAAPAVLARMGLSPALADRIAAFRIGPDGVWGSADDGFVPDVEQVFPVLDEQCGPLLPEDQERLGALISANLLGVRSSFFRIEADGWEQAHGVHRGIIGVVERAGAGAEPIVRGWNEAERCGCGPDGGQLARRLGETPAGPAGKPGCAEGAGPQGAPDAAGG